MSDDPAGNIIGAIVVAIIFVLLSALYSVAQEAFTVLGEIRIRDLEVDGNRKARRIRKLTEKRWRFAGCMRLGHLLNALLAITLIGSSSLLPLFTVFFSGGIPAFWATVLAAGVLLLAVTVFMAAFGHLLPRRLVYLSPETVALSVAGLVAPFYHLLRPLHWLCALLVSPILRMAGINPHEDPDTVTEEDIRQLMDAGEEIGAIEGTQKDMVNNIFEFDDTTAAEIMTPRTDVTAVEVEDPVSEALAACVENGYSRLPVYEEDIDHIIGILYIKDLLPYVGQAIPADITLRSLLRSTHFVPNTKKCDDLFEEMNEKHLQMAIVVDEYGGVAGIVTMEDLLESIVGSMQDEFDNEEEEVTQVEENVFEVDGATGVDDIGELIGFELPQGDYDTVAGFLMDQLGHIPEKDENPTVEYKNATFTIQKMDERRIEQVLIRIEPLTDEETEKDKD